MFPQVKMGMAVGMDKRDRGMMHQDFHYCIRPDYDGAVTQRMRTDRYESNQIKAWMQDWASR